MAVFNFNGRQRRHEKEMQGDSHLQRLAEMRAMQGWQSGEKALDRTYGTSEREDSQTFYATESEKGRKHATKSQKLNFRLGKKANRDNLKAVRENANEQRLDDDAFMAEALRRSGSTNITRDLGRIRTSRAMLEADTADFGRRGLSVRDAAAEGATEGEAKRWEDRARMFKNMNLSIAGATAMPRTGEITRHQMDAQVDEFETLATKNAQLREDLKNIPGLAGGAPVAGAYIRQQGTTPRGTLRPERRKSLPIPAELLE